MSGAKLTRIHTDCEKVERELVATKKAKAENDERFQIEAAVALRERDEAWGRGDRWSIFAQELDYDYGQVFDWAVVMNTLRITAECERDEAQKQYKKAVNRINMVLADGRRYERERDKALAALGEKNEV